MAKVFAKARYADAFMRGKLHANRLDRFRQMHTENDPRTDSEEGIAPLQDDGAPKVLLIPNSQPHRQIALYGPGSLKISRISNLNLLCMYAGLFESNQPLSLSDLSVPEEYSKFGPNAVLITDPAEFIRKVKSAVRRERYSVWRRAIRYVDPTTLDIEMFSDEIDVAFHKHSKYSSEKEYRFAIETNTQGSNAITLEIGGIEDIAVRVDTSQINHAIRWLLSRRERRE
ncbi:MAG: hypothetical protein OXH99_06590 [Bryobacterales bacterium]|nr:hypothetical protein [Bryobacterales bacterium]